ncbi:hypothetical protein RQP46_000945 [Phenoliferia psychrophenolica]
MSSPIGNSQAFDYSRSYRQDSRMLKATVAVLVALTIAETICFVLVLQYKLIANFGDVAAVELSPTANTVAEFLSPLICAVAQGFFAHRTYSTKKNIYVLVLLSVLILFTLSSGWALGGISLALDYTKTLLWVQINSRFTCATDVIISGIFIHSMISLRKPIADGEYELPARSILGKLLVMSFENPGRVGAICTQCEEAFA